MQALKLISSKTMNTVQKGTEAIPAQFSQLCKETADSFSKNITALEEFTKKDMSSAIASNKNALSYLDTLAKTVKTFIK